MPAASGRPRRFLVEVTPPRTGYLDIAALSERARAAAAATGSSPHSPVRFIRSVAIPEDGSCLLLFEAREPSAIEAVLVMASIMGRPLIQK